MTLLGFIAGLGLTYFFVILLGCYHKVDIYEQALIYYARKDEDSKTARIALGDESVWDKRTND